MKKIAIVGWSTGPNSFGVGKFYADFIVEIGGTPVILMPNMTDNQHIEMAKNVDLLILPGGADLSPDIYGESPDLFTGNNDVFKEFFFKKHLHKYVEAGTPIFGICLGFQMINVFFGGKLIQNLKYSDIHAKDTRGSENHKVRTVSGEMIPVNSHHHQGVSFDVLAKDLEPTAFSHVYDKTLTNKEIEQRSMVLIEAFEHKYLPIAGVQWHPEEWYEDHSRELISRVMSKSKKVKNEQD